MNLYVYVGVELVAHLCPDSSEVGSAGIIFPLAGMLTENSWLEHGKRKWASVQTVLRGTKKPQCIS